MLLSRHAGLTKLKSAAGSVGPSVELGTRTSGGLRWLILSSLGVYSYNYGHIDEDILINMSSLSPPPCRPQTALYEYWTCS